MHEYTDTAPQKIDLSRHFSGYTSHMSDHQKLTTEQQKAIQDILQRFRLESNQIVNRHRQRIKKILEDLDAKKAQEIQNMLSKNP